jgi:hypothetical protein
MTQRKKITFTVILTLIAALSAVFYYLDWSRYLNDIVIVISPLDPARAFKRIVSLLCLILVFITGTDAHNDKDRIFMRIIFVMIFAGDMALFFNANIAGIGIFFVTQLILVARNASGFIAFFISSSRARLDTAAAIGIVASIDAVLVRFVFLPLLEGRREFPFICVYMIALSVSLVAALLAPRIGRFNRRSALLISLGMVCFFLCDCTVGLRIALPEGLSRTLATSFTWVFYMPALVSIALSGYRPSPRRAHD